MENLVFTLRREKKVIFKGKAGVSKLSFSWSSNKIYLQFFHECIWIWIASEIYCGLLAAEEGTSRNEKTVAFTWSQNQATERLCLRKPCDHFPTLDVILVTFTSACSPKGWSAAETKLNMGNRSQVLSLQSVQMKWSHLIQAQSLVRAQVYIKCCCQIPHSPLFTPKIQ